MVEYIRAAQAIGKDDIDLAGDVCDALFDTSGEKLKLTLAD